MNDDVLLNDIQSTLEKFPGLILIYKNNKPYSLNGNIVIKDYDGIYQGDYDIEIIIPTNYPYGFPVLYEKGIKIERKSDRHINNEGKACLEVDLEIYFIEKKGITLLFFTEHYVYNYLCGQIYYQYYNEWPGEAWEHEGAGQYESFAKYLKIQDKGIIIKILGHIVTKPKPIRTSECLCGSGKKYRYCHKTQIEELYGFNKLKLFNIILKLNALKI